jgi:hypothetical protein
MGIHTRERALNSEGKSEGCVARRRVALCGSMSFISQIENIRRMLALEGVWAISPSPDELDLAGLDSAGYREYKRQISVAYLRKIKSPRTFGILVANLDKHGIRDYIGPNSFAEIAVAISHGKAAYLLGDYPDIYADELSAWGVVPLLGGCQRLISDYTQACLLSSQQLELNI